MVDQSHLPLNEFSPITEAVRRAFDWIKWLSVMRWLSLIFPLLRPRNLLTQEEVHDRQFVKRRARAIELYIAAWWVVEITLIVIACTFTSSITLSIVCAAIVFSRTVEIIQVAVNATLFDEISGRPDKLVASRARMLVLSAINFLEIAACFGIVYATNLSFLLGADQPLTAFYFSVINQLTMGYGDLIPTQWLRIVAAFQVLTSILFVILVFGRFMAALPRVRGLFDEPQDP